MDDKTLEVKKDMEIKVGYYENEISKQEKFATKDYYVHDEFSVSKDGVVNNIAVVELKDGPLTDSEKMANLFSMENIWPGIAMTTYGWGTGEPVSFDNSGNNRTDALRMGLVMTGDLDFCKERIDGFVDHNESGICVMFNAKLPNAICSGDAGTGLYFSDENKKQVLVAISSFVVGEKGKLCGKSDSVTYFTKVDDYTEFIFKKR